MENCGSLRPRILPDLTETAALNRIHQVTPGDRGERDTVTHARAPACWEEVARRGAGGGVRSS